MSSRVARPPSRAQGIVYPQLAGVPFEEPTAALGDQLCDHRTRSGRYLLDNVGHWQRFSTLGVIAQASAQAETDEALPYQLPVPLGVYRIPFCSPVSSTAGMR